MSDAHRNERSSSGSTTGSTASAGGSNPSGAGQGGASEESEEQEEPSSSSLTNNNDERMEELLASFREQWQREIEKSPQRVVGQIRQQQQPQLRVSDIQQTPSSLQQQTPALESEIDDPGSVENKAKNFFLKGMEYEQDGKLYDAIRFYRRAVQLVPDIEFRLYSSKMQNQKEEDEEDDTNGNEEDSSDSMDEVDVLDRAQKVFNKTHCICLPEYPQKTTHISALPLEIMLYIMRWVVSSELDIRSLEMCSRVCRGFYLCCRDPKIWRLACTRVWGITCADFDPYQSWREMYIKRPRLNFHGCYISKTSYIRYGENSFQDQFYSPVHLVAYFRYLRFFPGGTVLMLTTADEPPGCVGQLTYRTPRHPQVLSGYYCLSGSCVTVVLQRQQQQSQRQLRTKGRRGEQLYDPGEQTFHLKLQIKNYKEKVHVQLVWECYSIFTRFRNGNETTTSFSVQGSRYPPFWFSRVKSYTATSESLLQ
ncbi:F-box only protein 9 [Schistocerca serialis cubense]|uniref:F-box only protein 9 n=1 Tax=Schistocerca serialis cubense TaxID=2023355 RepID=UPI00214EA86C|nr:F-box only protein 9 [Schistocerca serialis cubense]